jgi:hypothetical protein
MAPGRPFLIGTNSPVIERVKSWGSIGNFTLGQSSKEINIKFYC